ncbi:glycosyltransferase family 4 protein [Clostridium sp. 001]|uniref:glycosyltransferase family 4 protein n=1 Tax=Clostridium sp. 001 TaxID=1970093 RepID=UPI001C2B9001|nr:glycosyltransferase family 4 protein [Clostridium sp. 001]
MEKGKQKILIVHNYYQIPGGEDTVVANERKLLEKHGHKVILYTRNNSELKELSKFQKLLLPFTTVFNIRTYREVKKIIREQQIDIVHVHNTLNLISPSVYYAALSCKKPVVQTVHNFRLLCPGATFYRDGYICEDCINNGLKCAVKHSCYRGSKMQTLACVISTKIHRMLGIYGKLNYICLTEFNKQKLLKLKQIRPERVFVKPNFVESSEEIIPYECRENQFVFAGRIDKLKGVDILLKAWNQMEKEAPKLVICGTGPMEEWCKQYIIENGLISVEMKGFVPNSESRKIIANSKALILPTQWYEGFPMTIAEAFAVATPVITSDLGNAGSLIKEGITGCKFKCDSPNELVEAIHRLASYKNIQCITKKIYDQKYTRIQNYKYLMKIYSASVGEGKVLQ